jgi:hypothetical protein
MKVYACLSIAMITCLINADDMEYIKIQLNPSHMISLFSSSPFQLPLYSRKAFSLSGKKHIEMGVPLRRWF